LRRVGEHRPLTTEARRATPDILAQPASLTNLLREEVTAENKTKRGSADRARVAAGEKYEVDSLMKSLNPGRDDAERLIAKYDGNREKRRQRCRSENRVRKPMLTSRLSFWQPRIPLASLRCCNRGRHT
jgi:hypothetical protein